MDWWKAKLSSYSARLYNFPVAQNLIFPRLFQVMKTWPLTTVRRWAASPNSFTLVSSSSQSKQSRANPILIIFHYFKWWRVSQVMKICCNWSCCFQNFLLSTSCNSVPMSNIVKGPIISLLLISLWFSSFFFLINRLIILPSLDQWFLRLPST